MKKLFIILMVLLLASCSINFEDEEGFSIFGYGLSYLTEDNVLIQSHDGYVINDIIHNEGFFDKPVTIINVLSRPVDVKITDVHGKKCVEIEPFGELQINDV